MNSSLSKKTYHYSYTNLDKFVDVFGRIIKFVSNLFLILFVTILLVMLVYSIYNKKVGNTTTAPLISAYVIVSPSMVPTINVLDAVVALRPNADNLKKGDIITFNSEDVRYTGLTVTHRILKVETKDNEVVYKTKGDNNTTSDDASVTAKSIFGKVILVIPWLGYLQYLLTKPLGWVILIVVPCVGLIIYDVIKLKNQISRSKKKTNIKFRDVEVKEEKEII